MRHRRLHGKLINHAKFCGVRRCAVLVRYGFLNFWMLLIIYETYYNSEFRLYSACCVACSCLFAGNWLNDCISHSDNSYFNHSTNYTVIHIWIITVRNTVIQPIIQGGPKNCTPNSNLTLSILNGLSKFFHLSLK